MNDNTNENKGTKSFKNITRYIKSGEKLVYILRTALYCKASLLMLLETVLIKVRLASSKTCR